jgi:hypothetical protein
LLTLKPLSVESIPGALAKAERYRLLHEPVQAESICEDILQIQPDNQQALVMLLLAITDRFDKELAVGKARALLTRLQSDYDRSYYEGIISERVGHARLGQGGPGSGTKAYESFREAMICYERAEDLRPAGNDDSVLRWNTCARFLNSHQHLEPQPEDRLEPLLLE